MLRQTFVPDLDNYVQVRIPRNSGCAGCIFFGMPNVRCSAIPCIPRMDRPWPVIYQEKPNAS